MRFYVNNKLELLGKIRIEVNLLLLKSVEIDLE